MPTAESAGSAPAARPLPRPFLFPRGEASPGQVTFRHKTHLGKSGECATCHPKPFAMTAVTRADGGMHETDACGACHDGKKAFDSRNAEACMRCHVESGGTP